MRILLAVIAGAFCSLGIVGPSSGLSLQAPARETPARETPAPPLTAYSALPTISLVRLSDDGTVLASLRQTDDQAEVLIQAVDGQLITRVDVSDRKVTGVSWLSPDHVGIHSSVYEGGLTIGATELPQLDIVNVRTRGVARALRTADRAVINAVYGHARRVYRGRPALYVEAITNQDNAYTLDVYRVDMDSGRGVRVAEGNRDTTGYLLGQDGEPAVRIALATDSGRLRLSVPDGLGWKQIFERTELIDTPNVWGFGPEGDSVLVGVTENGRDVMLELALADGARRERLELPGAPNHSLYDRQGRLLALGVGGDEVAWIYFEPKVEAAAAIMQQGLRGRRVSLVSLGESYDQIIAYSVGVETIGDSGTYYLYDAVARRVSVVGRAYPAVPNDQVGPVRRIRYVASDGLEIPGYLTVPSGLPVRALPLVVLPHGGPQSRDYSDFDWLAQALASRGYAVLQPNFRGSSGLGEAHLQAGYGEWGRKMQTDLSDGVQYLAGEGLIDPDRVCIMGASYGGYAALAGVTLENGVYRCAVAVAAVTDLTSFLEGQVRQQGSGAESRNPVVRYWNRFMGGAGSGDRRLDERSPARRAADVTAPILLIHGRQDTVVPFSQSTTMERALEMAGKPVELIALENEDHNLSRAATRRQMLEATVAFLERHNPPDTP
ncbi:MAG: S9 family peptidase [Caulobacteraceae bacterium]|nr:S9 family peptidase [Caulobacteraceae bacterium]